MTARARDWRQGGRRPRRSFAGWRNRLLSSPSVLSRLGRLPVVRHLARREGEALFAIVSGFVQSQVLAALVELRVLHLLMEETATPGALAPRLNLPPERCRVLLQAGAALGLLERTRRGYRTSRRGAALVGVPGLEAMIRHHDVLYRDLSDPVALFRGESETELAQVWPYVLSGQMEAEDAARYSTLMAESQRMVAEDTLDAVSLRRVRHLMDVGGGTGAFLREVARRHPGMRLTLFDLPQVLEAARGGESDVSGKVDIVAGDFRSNPLPEGADAISLVRVLYDHDNRTVAALLRRVHDALPPGGQVIVSEPMSGGAWPERATDVYFALYTLAMRTGRTRSADEIATHLSEAGFSSIRCPRARRPFVTRVVTATRA